MRLSVFRLSIPRLSFDWLEGFGGRRFFLYALFTGLLFVIFAIVNFPYRAAVERALSELDLQPFRLEVAATRFAWFKGVELRGVQLTEPERSAWPLLESSQLYLRPGLGGLLRGSLSSVNANGTLYGGAIDVRWVGGEGMTRTALEFRGLQLARYRPLTSLLETGQVTGVLSGAATVEEPSGNPRAARAAGDLNLQGGGVLGAAVAGFAVPDLHFDTITLEFALQGGRFEIEAFEALGDELRLSGSGQVALREPVEDSVLNLQLTVQPGPASTDSIRGLLALVPRAKGARPDAPLLVTGTLKKPRFR